MKKLRFDRALNLEIGLGKLDLEGWKKNCETNTEQNSLNEETSI